MHPSPESLDAPTRNASVFVDGQNLYHAARECFGHTVPNYDVRRLAELACHKGGWRLQQIFFYTGVPDARFDPHWHRFWYRKILALRHQGIEVFSRTLRHSDRLITLPDGSTARMKIREEKGIDVRIAIDVIGKAYRRTYDVAIVFSQDQDLSEVADEIRQIAKEQRRWIKMASAFPFRASRSLNSRGINGTDWIRISQAEYDACLDPVDYRRKQNEPELQ